MRERRRMDGIHASTQEAEVNKYPKKALWFTWEFMFYYFAMFCMVMWMIAKYTSVSNLYQTGEKEKFPGLEKGWLLGRIVDLSDFQYKSWRSNFPLLACFMGIHIITSHIIRRNFSGDKPRLLCYIIFGAFFVLFVFRSSCLIFLSVLMSNYVICNSCGSSVWNPILTWTFNLSILVTSKLCNGYSFSVFGSQWAFLDSFGGILSWQTHFNITFTRTISYNMDYYWMKRAQKGQTEMHKLSQNASELSRRTVEVLPLESYSLLHYLGYTLYAPLLLAGPVLPFNAFSSQLRRSQTTYSLKGIMMLLAEMIAWNVLLEVLIHYIYFYGINDQQLWMNEEMPPLQVGLGCFFTLEYMWIKFFIIWRFFRVCSLFEGVDTPENMLRWVNNNYSFSGFWRGWHSSLNRWIVRYMYVPLGGGKSQLWSMWVIFTLIGIWHDLWWRWVCWAWLSAICFSVELLITRWSKNKNIHPRVSCLLFVFSSIFLCISNLSIGLGFVGIYHFFAKTFLSDDGTFFVWTSIFFYISSRFMLEFREHEKRQGKRMLC